MMARQLRERGLSASKIAKTLGISRMSVLRWCEDMASNNKYHLKRLERHNACKEKGAEVVKSIKLNTAMCKIFTSLIYWCEGSKYPSTNSVSFTNSDPVLVKTFIDFFRNGFTIDEKKFRVILQLHTTHDFVAVNRYWSELLNIPFEQFYKATITVPKKVMKRRGYLGTCTIRYNNVNILMEIVGIYHSIGNLGKGGRVA